MSVQFGRWNLDRRPADQSYFDQVKRLLISYGPDGHTFFKQNNIGIVYCAFHTTHESRSERQPYVMASGAVLTWDGRLDNRRELIGSQLGNIVNEQSTDVAIVAAAYDRWGSNCFEMLIGDWALSLWDPRARSLVLAKDPLGTRHLYYSIDKQQVTWSTILDPLVLLSGKTFTLCEEYIAGWLSYFPAAHLTPYVGIDSVPPSCSVVIREGQARSRKYWDFDPSRKIRYGSDAEYEEHFRSVFAAAVKRRLRSDSPVLAELSGGMDSSSIVCMADAVMMGGDAETPRLDTISYYDDSEPNWNERPYFTRVEEKRGRSGCHINTASQIFLPYEIHGDQFMATPSSGASTNEPTRRFVECMASQGNRVVLSGIGGDEVLGGVPTPIPELADLLARCRFITFASRLGLWALNRRKPWIHIFYETILAFFPPTLVGVHKSRRPAAWLKPAFVKRHRSTLWGYEQRLRAFSSLPSLQVNLSSLEVLRRQLSCAALPVEAIYEKRYPYLDRDLLEFIFAIPRGQVVRPGERRSLMRRSLRDLVPEELLNRKRKAFVARAPLAAIQRIRTHLMESMEEMVSTASGIIDPKSFAETLESVGRGSEVPLVPLLRTLHIESWLSSLKRSGVLSGHSSGTKPELQCVPATSLGH
jgi:asparagine synthase (glutamine-hydrolysing)